MKAMNRKEKRIQKILSIMEGKITGLEDLTAGKKPTWVFYLMGARLGRLMEGRLDRVSLTLRRWIHPVIRLVAPLFMEHKQVFESRNDLLGLEEPDEKPRLPDGPLIWCPNHGFRDDVVASILAARHSYILFGSIPMLFNTFDGLTAWINGIVVCNRRSRESKRISEATSQRLLEMGGNLLMYPEGVWNKSPERLILPLWPGVYRMAKKTGARVVPIVHYLADPLSKEDVIHTVVGEPISMEGLTEAEGLALLRDTMATWYYLMMEHYGRSTRSQVLRGYETADEAWDAFCAAHAKQVEYYDREIELKADYRPKGQVEPEEVWKPVAEAGHPWAIGLVEAERRRNCQRRY